MNEIQKNELMMSVTHGTLKSVQDKFPPCELIIQDQNFFDYEILKAALKRQHRSIINFLFKVGCRVTCPNKVKYEETPLHIAMGLDNSNILTTLLKRGASIYYKNANGETPIHAGFKQGFYCAANLVLNYIYVDNLLYKDLNPTNIDDICHFHIACILNNLQVVKLFLKHRFNMNTIFSLDSTKFHQANLLHYTASKHRSEMLVSLIQHGADLSIKNVDGQTILHTFYYSNQFRYMIETVFNLTNDTKFINSIDCNDVSHFHLSCTLNNPDLVKVFIDNGVDINSAVSANCPLNPGFTPLHFAVQYRCDKVVQLLLKSGANCNLVDSEGVTPLHLACASFYLHLESVRSIIDMLLDYNACVTTANKKGQTSLHKMFWNSSYQETKILDMLISRIPRGVNFTDNQGLSHFHIICTRNDTSQVEDFLKSGVNVDLCVTVSNYTWSIYSGYTPLHFAVLYNQRNIVEVLLKWKAQVNIQSKKLKVTPLHLACECSYIKVREIYNQQHKQVISNEKMDSDWILNHENQLLIIKLLLWYGADIEAEDIDKATPLFWTCMINYQDFPILFTDTWDTIDNILKKEICYRAKKIIEILISNNVKINVRTEEQKSILHFVNKNHFLQNSEELIEFLIINGADVNAYDKNMSSLLHETCTLKNKKMLQMLLKHKANVNVVNLDLLTPLEVIVAKFSNSPDDKEMLSSLLEYGSNVNISMDSCQGISKIGVKTLLHNAIENWDIFLVEKLLYYGADINVKDIDGNTCVSYLFKWSEERMQRMWENNIGYAKMFETVFIHVQKLLALGLHVDEEVKKICIKLHEIHSIARVQHDDSVNLNNIYNNCIDELNRMKLIKIDNYTCLYSILTKDIHELSKKVNNGSLIEQLEDGNVCDNFPLYAYLLKLQFRKALQRSEALENANWSLCSITGLFLPNPCCDAIFKNMTNKDITTLKVVAESPSTSYKRKWIRSNSKNTKFPAKLRRLL